MRGGPGAPEGVLTTPDGASQLPRLAGPEGPDGLVLSSTILTDKKSRPVPAKFFHQFGTIVDRAMTAAVLFVVNHEDREMQLSERHGGDRSTLFIGEYGGTKHQTVRTLGAGESG